MVVCMGRVGGHGHTPAPGPPSTHHAALFHTPPTPTLPHPRHPPTPPTPAHTTPVCVRRADGVLKYEYEDLFKPYGFVDESVKIRNKDQALVQMESLEGA